RPRRHDFRVVGLDGGGNDDDLRAVEVFSGVADPHGDAEPGKPARIGALCKIAALHPVSEIVQHLGDPAHPDAADPDEMDRPDRFGQRSHAAYSLGAASMPARASTMRVSRSAASSQANRRACAAAWASPAASARRSARIAVSIVALSSDCGITQPAPASAKARALAVWWSSVACG